MTLVLDSHFLTDVTNGNYTVGSAITDSITLERFNNLVTSFEIKLTSDGLVESGAFIQGGEWGAAYLIADLIHRNKLMNASDVTKEAWGSDYSYEIRSKTVSEMSIDYFIDKYQELVEALNQDELGITEEVIDGVERDDSEIWFAGLDGNPLPIADNNNNELIRRDL